MYAAGKRAHSHLSKTRFISKSTIFDLRLSASSKSVVVKIKNPLPINMVHVFALAYLTTGFLLSTLLFFHCFARYDRVHCTTAHAQLTYIRI